MKTYRRFFQLSAGILAVTGLVLMSGSIVFAQGTGELGGGIDKPNTNRAGTNGAAELLVPLTARYSALGGATTSVLSQMNGLEALYANPAGLTNNQSTSALFSRLQYVADIGVNYFGLAQRFGDNNLALTISAWDMGEIHRQTELDPEKADATFRVSFINAGLTFARTLTDRIAAGATLKIINHTIDDLTATGIVFDAGMTYVVGETGLRLGVALKNIGNELQYSGTGLGRRVRLPDQPTDASVNTVQLESEGVQYPTLLNFGVRTSARWLRVHQRRCWVISGQTVLRMIYSAALLSLDSGICSLCVVATSIAARITRRSIRATPLGADCNWSSPGPR